MNYAVLSGGLVFIDFLHRFVIDHIHTGKCIRRFGGIYAYYRYFIDQKW